MDHFLSIGRHENLQLAGGCLLVFDHRCLELLHRALNIARVIEQTSKRNVRKRLRRRFSQQACQRPGLAAFSEIWNPQRTMQVGGDGIAIAEFLEAPVEQWIGA